ncbi:tudor and KH domain-containing protein homolog [Leptopilina heterotoma]|uniref:tudor and KH domain-containing protein homolog n=1 Tax=Leptopilina heterotoma TaxID=63436 RepID=UPI001CAA341A|nr:tudor and KH domain-containing protein homolog [Leptopilina heterotoma]XP_043467815.1 tudor and KH domain-containing protein homolog [Leptopilina heterotoma]
MKLTPQQLLMPLLVGFSLTGVSCILLYFFTRKDEDEINDRRKTRIATSRQSEIQIKIPRSSIPAIIGRGGSVIKEIQATTETQVKFGEETDVDAPDRICIIQGKPESIRLAEVMILDIIRNQPVIETHEMKVAQKYIGRIMGKGGESIKHIQAISNARIIVDSSMPSRDPNLERSLTIKGTTEQISTAVEIINDKIREENETREKLESNVRQPRSAKSPSPRSNGIETKFEKEKSEENVDEQKKSETEDSEEDTESESLQDENFQKETKNTEKMENSTASSSELKAESLPLQSSTMEIFVSACETPSQFFVQVYGPGTLALDELVDKMTVYYNNQENAELHTLKNITVDQMVAAKFCFDSRWYRSEVIAGPDEQGNYEVFFLDFGDRATVPRSEILELRTDFLSLRLQAVECSLANVKPRGGIWSEGACDQFAELTYTAQWKKVFAKVKGYNERAVGCGRSRREGSPIPSIIIYDIIDNKEIDVAKQLISENLAEPDEEILSSAASSTISGRRRNNSDFRKSPTPTSVKPNKVIHEIDLTTPIKDNKKIEEIDLVSPVTNQTSQFIYNEKKSFNENGSGNYSQNNRNFKSKPSIIVPAGYESDRSAESDFELE